MSHVTFRSPRGWTIFSSYLSFTYIYATGAFIDLYRDGGARPQGIQNNVDYSGTLDLLPKFWLAVSACLVLFFLFKREFRVKRYLIVNPFFALLTLSLISGLWAKYPSTALFYATQLLLMYICLALIIDRYGSQKLFTHLSHFSRVISLCSIVFSLFFPSYGISVNSDSLGAWQGVFFHKNTLGGFFVIALFVELHLYHHDKDRSRLIVAMLYIALVFLSESSTALVSCGALLFLTIFFSNFRRHSEKVSAFLLLSQAIALTLIIHLVNSPTTSLIPFLKKDTTFSGRDSIWRYTLDEASQHPFLGWGLGQFSANNTFNGEDFFLAIGYITSTPHNGLIEIFHSLGYVGIFIFIAALIHYAVLSKGQSAASLAFIQIFILVNFFESRLLSFNIYLVAFSLIYYASLSHKYAHRNDTD